MKIVIIGSGKLGRTLAEQLIQEDHDITMVDENASKLQYVVNRLDILGIHGNGATIPVLREAGVDDADLVIAATAEDELNLLACLIAKRVGARNTIARVRNPEYIDVMSLVKQDLGLSLSINPELACAVEMSRVLKFPSMITVDTFAKGRVEILKFEITEDSPLAGMKLRDVSRFKKRILVCAVERNDSEIYIPSGDFQLRAGDHVSIVGDTSHIPRFLSQIGMMEDKIHNIIIVGGGRIGYYLAKQMIESDVDVTLVEHDLNRCHQLAELLPEADIIHGDGTDQQVLIEIGVESADSFASLTGFDEENIMMSLYVGSMSKAKRITKVTRIPFTKVIAQLNAGSVFFPVLIAAEHIIRYVRAMQNSYGSNVETLCRIIDDKAEALEFYVNRNSPLIDIPLMDMELKENVLVGTINRGGRIIIPGGSDVIQPGDTVIVVTTIKGLNALEDILR